jgi:hypothetical protein
MPMGTRRCRSPKTFPGDAGGWLSALVFKRLPVLKEVEAEARRRKVDLVLLPTARAIEALAGTPADTNAILHLTC